MHRPYSVFVSRYLHRWLICGVLSVVMLVVCGCTTLQVWTGMRVRLEKTPIASLHAVLPQGPAMYPGEKTPLVVMVVQPGGKVMATEGAGQGKVLWEDLLVTPELVTVERAGIVAMPADPRITDAKNPRLAITVPSHPAVRTELTIALRYDHAFIADFSGRAGARGMDGMDGSSGMSGSDGSTDATDPSPGGDGSAGSDGGDGQDGGPGEDGPAVLVRVAMHPGESPLLQVCVSGKGSDEYFLVDPTGGSLTVKAEGGKGGYGGRGGRGGKGGSGGCGFPPGFGGIDGHDGNDGPGGKGGTITVRYTRQARKYLAVISLSTRDGNGRPGTPPVFEEWPISPLW
jgi:hypothetical protein